ncbi:hypothetical protein J437_LFUL013905 [Ladona fulva]|nr:hypothetical protein J437_LFUL013905 [Ladona fulva]
MFHQYPVRVDVDLEARTAIVSPPDNIPGLGKSRTFYDYNTRVIAYKDYRSKQCHLERMSDEEKLPGVEEDSTKQNEEGPEGSEAREAERRLHRQMGLLGPTQHNRNRQKRAPQSKQLNGMRRKPKTLYVTETVLSKYEVLRLAGRRISHFCRGFPATLLVQRPPNPTPKLQSPARIPWLSENELPGEGSTESEEHRLLLEAALVKARLAELELQTLDSSDEESPQDHGKTNKGTFLRALSYLHVPQVALLFQSGLPSLSGEKAYETSMPTLEPRVFLPAPQLTENNPEVISDFSQKESR